MSGKDKVVLNGRDNFEVWKFQYEVFKAGMKEKDRMKLLVSTINENVLRKIITCKTSVEIEIKLQNLFGVSLAVNKLYLQNKFYTLKCDGNVVDFVEEVDNIANKLEEAGEILSDEMKIAKILNNLPKSFESFVTAFECANVMSFEMLRAKLNIECERRNLKKNDQNYVKENVTVNNEETPSMIENTAFVAESTDSGRTCNYCKRTGHLLKDCYILKKKNSSIVCYKCNNAGHIARHCSEKTNVVPENKYNIAATVLSVNDREQSLFKTEWIVDSGATQHMSCNKEMFTDLNLVQNKEVIMPNGTSMSVAGIGTIEIKTDKVNLSLSRVLFVPSLKFNLLATKPFTDVNVQLLFDKDKAKFIKNNETIMSATYTNGLYILDQEKLFPTFANLTLGEWHQRPGYQNPTYIKDIVRRNNIIYKNEDSTSNSEPMLTKEQLRYLEQCLNTTKNELENVLNRNQKLQDMLKTEEECRTTIEKRLEESEFKLISMSLTLEQMELKLSTLKQTCQEQGEFLREQGPSVKIVDESAVAKDESISMITGETLETVIDIKYADLEEEMAKIRERLQESEDKADSLNKEFANKEIDYQKKLLEANSEVNKLKNDCDELIKEALCLNETTREKNKEIEKLKEYLRAITITNKLYINQLSVTVGSAEVYEDNSSCISIASNPCTKRTKHFDVKFHFIKEKIDDGTMRLNKVNTEDQTADMFTKALSTPRFKELRNKLNLV